MKTMTPDQLDTAAKTLSEAFWNDPLVQIIAPDEGKRAVVGPWFFSTALNYGMRWGQVWCNDNASAVAIWLTPGNTTMSPIRMLRSGMGALPFKAGFGSFWRFMQGSGAAEKFHKTLNGPHWYLLALGTRLELQGTGLGTALIEMGASKADAARLPCYLETGTESNVAFYEKRGFKIIGQADTLGFTLYGMVRPPQ